MNISTFFLPASAISPEKWNAFIEASPQGNVFALYEYMQIIAPNWAAIIVAEGDTWRAVFPIISQKKMGFHIALQPVLAQHWGIFLGNNDYKNDYEAFSAYRKIVLAIIEKLPQVHVFFYQFSPTFPYLIAFGQAGYELRTRFTYHLALEKTENELWQNAASPLQRQIKKTQKQNFQLRINQKEDLRALVAIFSQNEDTGKNLTGLGKQHFVPILEKLTKIGHYFLTENKGILLTLADADGKVQAGGIFGLCRKKMTYIAGGVSPEYRADGLMSRLLWEAILYGKQHNCFIFDFEGSMIEGIETFFRKFGAVPVPYLQIVRNKLPFYLKWLPFLRF